jgi:hypothetical protein
LKLLKTILPAALISGTLDAAAAVVLYAKPLNLHTAAGIFRYIASALVGSIAFSSGPVYALLGLLLHYLIAFIWSLIYMLILFRVFKPGFLWIKIILFSCMVWIVMNGLVLPTFGLTSTRHETWTTLKSYAPILLCVAFPICIILEKQLRIQRD